MILDLIKNSRTHRHFDETKLKEEDILKILTAARFAPIARNNQNLRYAYTLDDDKCKEIFKNIVLGGGLKADEKPTLEERPRAIISILTDNNENNNQNSLFFNLGLASQNITLAANELGFSACIVMAFSKEVDKILNIPVNFSSKIIIALGKGTEEVEIVDVHSGENTAYYRKNGKHYVPKIVLDDLIISK